MDSKERDRGFTGLPGPTPIENELAAARLEVEILTGEEAWLSTESTLEQRS